MALFGNLGSVTHNGVRPHFDWARGWRNISATTGDMVLSLGFLVEYNMFGTSCVVVTDGIPFSRISSPSSSELRLLVGLRRSV